jgi:hypothetical protein
MSFKAVSSHALNRLLQEAKRESTANRKIGFDQDSVKAVPQRESDARLQSHRLLTLQAEREIAGRDDPFRVATELLQYVSNQMRSVAAMEGLVAVLSPSPRLPSSPSVRLLAMCQFSQNDIQIDPASAQVVIAYSEILESLVSSDISFNTMVYASLRAQFIRNLQHPPSWFADLLPLYSLLLVSEAKQSKGELIALDLFSEATEAIEAYRNGCDLDATLETVSFLVAMAMNHGYDATECLRAFTHLQPKQSKLQELSLAECKALIADLLVERHIGFRELISLCRWFRRLAVRDPARHAPQILLAGARIARDRHQSHIANELGQVLDNAMESKVDVHRIQYAFRSFEKGELSGPLDFLRAMERMTDVKQLETLASHRVITDSAMSRVDRLQGTSAAQLLSPELLQTRLRHWHDLNAIHRGFTSRLIAARRGPFREPPDLVQFAIDVGSEKSVRYINAKDPNLFPGKGFFVTRLKLAHCFAPGERIAGYGSPTGDPYAIYKRAWPSLAQAMDHFDDAEFIFLRGCLLISCKRRDYLLPSGMGEHYSLIVFNDHFRNPFQEVAYLVPNQGVAQLLAGTQIPYSDFVGFDTRRPDLNEQLQSPQGFLQHPLIAEKAIDVGGVSAILSGFEEHLERIGQSMGLASLKQPAEDLRERTQSHNASIADWEQQSHRYHQSEAGQKHMFELSAIGKRLEGELGRLGQQRTGILSGVEDRIWQLVDKYTALHSLFCIAHAYWHRGYTAGRSIETSHIDETGSKPDMSFSGGQIQQGHVTQDQLQIELDSKSDDNTEMSNRNSIRMLVQAYEWHSMREDAEANRDDFPILVLCDALQLGVQPKMDFFIDTYDMMVHLEGNRIPLSQGRMSGDDELFWFTTLFPRIQDQTGVIRDLRFYPRASLDMNDANA